MHLDDVAHRRGAHALAGEHLHGAAQNSFALLGLVLVTHLGHGSSLTKRAFLFDMAAREEHHPL
jgi:hypothetical protein